LDTGADSPESFLYVVVGASKKTGEHAVWSAVAVACLSMTLR
jgi:hypothetical protein